MPIKIKADYHLHSSFSGDSQTPMKQMIERGIELGLSTMCFTEHIDMDYPYDKKEDEGMFDLNTYSYLYDLACAKGDYADKIKILFGIEIGVQPHLAFKLAEYARTYEFDFIIASSHVCNHKDPYYPAFFEALVACATDLAKMIAHDGEGATKFLEVNVTGAATWEDAKTAAMAIAKSPLVKTAFFGEDPNWGHIVCAAGYSGADMEADKVNLSIGGIRLVENGMNCNVPAEKLAPTMAEHDISMSIDLGAGEESATVWTCDFSYEYVKINGEYHT